MEGQGLLGVAPFTIDQPNSLPFLTFQSLMQKLLHFGLVNDGCSLAMRILPVLDLMGSRVVRAVAGERHAYRPVVSRLTPSSEPLAVAAAFRSHFGLSELYLADLDAIAGAEPDEAVFATLGEHGFRLWVDAGVRDRTRALRLARGGVQGVVVGLETVTGPAALAAICGEMGDRVVFSLDLRGGRPLGDLSSWQGADAEAIARQAIDGGVRRVLVLDLAHVGTGRGPGTADLCRRLVEVEGIEVWAGGGVRGAADLRALRDNGVRTVLVASALHDGALTRADLETLGRP
jgi:phosphoribosylformimino-5-aminoimidazole carboxamide ribotide isomerase